MKNNVLIRGSILSLIFVTLNTLLMPLDTLLYKPFLHHDENYYRQMQLLGENLVIILFSFVIVALLSKRYRKLGYKASTVCVITAILLAVPFWIMPIMDPIGSIGFSIGFTYVFAYLGLFILMPALLIVSIIDLIKSTPEARKRFFNKNLLTQETSNKSLKVTIIVGIIIALVLSIILKYLLDYLYNLPK